MRQMRPKAIGDVAKKRAVESATRKIARVGCIIYGGWG